MNKLLQKIRKAIVLIINPILIVLNIGSPAKYYNRIARQELKPAQVDGFLIEYESPHIAEAFERNVEKINTFIHNEEMQILDIGCGTGRYLQAISEQFPTLQLYGIDVSTATLDNYTRQMVPNARLQVADFTQENPFAIVQFDFIYSLGVLQHIQFFKLSRFFKHIHSALKPDGSFYFVFGSGKNWLDVITNRHFYRYPPEFIHKQLIRSGFVIQESGMLTSKEDRNLGYFFVVTPKRMQ